MLRLPVFVRFALVAGLLGLAGPSLGCASASDDRANTARQWLEALANRDAKAVYGLVDPAVIQKVVALHGTLRETRELIMAELPAAQRKAALAAAPLPDEGGPEDLFVALFSAEGAQAALGSLDTLGLRPKSIEGEGASAVVTTLGGDKVTLVQDQTGAWRVALGADDAARLDTLLAKAEQNRSRLRELVGRLGERRFGKK